MEMVTSSLRGPLPASLRVSLSGVLSDTEEDSILTPSVEVAGADHG